ncbi:MAG TPA: hypothetical protein VFZ06_13800 [Acidimicrobiia bacterium]|nr:hypothetical protein [Acidimicrobiia bacterium]
MIELNPSIALALALLAPAAVIGWAALFSVLGIEHGPLWSQRHLRTVLRILGILLLVSIISLFVIRPIWVPFAVAYPVATGALLAWGRVRQLAFVEKSGGFTEIAPDFRRRLAGRLTRGLIVASVLAIVVGVVLVVSAYWQGWIMVVLAFVIGFALSRARQLQAL